MSVGNQQDRAAKRKASKARRVTKKDQVISLYTSGISDVEELAKITGARPSYVASVLQGSGLMFGYFDLYTTTAHPMNVHSKFFARRLGFRDEAAARASVEFIDRFYRQFEHARDRVGQHHALMMALTMFDRARWTGKGDEADIFRHWLIARLNDTEIIDEESGNTASSNHRPCLSVNHGETPNSIPRRGPI